MCNLYNIVICLVFVICMIYPPKVPRAVASVLVCQMTSVPWCMTRGAVRAGCSTLQRKRSPSTGGTLLCGNTGINNCQSRTKMTRRNPCLHFEECFRMDLYRCFIRNDIAQVSVRAGCTFTWYDNTGLTGRSIVIRAVGKDRYEGQY